MAMVGLVGQGLRWRIICMRDKAREVDCMSADAGALLVCEVNTPDHTAVHLRSFG